MRRKELIYVAVALASVLSLPKASAAERKLSADTLAPNMISNGKTATASINLKALHRLDFMIKGTSCPACLLKLQNRLESAAGVSKVAVMLKKPFAAVCIYDSGKLNQAKLLVIAKGNEQKVSFDSVEDAPLEKMPVLLIPHHATDNTP